MTHGNRITGIESLRLSILILKPSWLATTYLRGLIAMRL